MEEGWSYGLGRNSYFICLFPTYYDKIADKAKGKIVFVTDGGVICRVISDGKDKPVIVEEDKVNDENL